MPDKAKINGDIVLALMEETLYSPRRDSLFCLYKKCYAAVKEQDIDRKEEIAYKLMKKVLETPLNKPESEKVDSEKLVEDIIKFYCQCYEVIRGDEQL
ncbi:MAG: hypothetical protein D3908_15985 [Candidatus Electrothrix sp. AUS4]|nr:hypothetical protein [Candidatus Electrothrix sp. AUS4]